MHNSRSMPAVALLLAVLSLSTLWSSAAGAQTEPRVPARVQLVGDSLARSVQDSFPVDWRVRARGGRALSESMEVLGNAMHYSPECVVIALGSNDVGRHRSRAQMLADLEHAETILAGLPCVAWTTVKVDGLHPAFGPSWARYARMWNALLRNNVAGTILDWDAVARTHPGYFIGDGLHLTASGRVAYANFLRRGVVAA